MESKLGKWLKRIIIIVIVMGLVAFGVIKLIENKTSNVEKSAVIITAVCGKSSTFVCKKFLRLKPINSLIR